jgi:hypothetical protein
VPVHSILFETEHVMYDLLIFLCCSITIGLSTMLFSRCFSLLKQLYWHIQMILRTGFFELVKGVQKATPLKKKLLLKENCRKKSLDLCPPVVIT